MSQTKYSPAGSGRCDFELYPIAALLGWLQISGPSASLVLSVSWDFWFIGLVLLVAASTFHPPQAARKSSLDRAAAARRQICPSFQPNNNFFTQPSVTPSSDSTKRKKHNLPQGGFCLKFNYKSSFPLHSLLLARPVLNFSKTETSEFCVCIVSTFICHLQTFRNQNF